MIHILFGDSPAGSLNNVLKKMRKQHLEIIISFGEIFSVGPIQRLQEEIGIEKRIAWLQHAMFDDLSDYSQIFQQALKQLQTISEDVPITIWAAENAHEQTGLRFVLHLLKKRDNAISLINTTKAFDQIFQNGKLIIRHTGEIASEQLQLLYEQSIQTTPLTKLERETYEEQWRTLNEKRELLRIWRNREIVSVPVEYYDQYIVNMAKELQLEYKPEDFMKSAILIGSALGHLDQYVGDNFLEYRVRTLVEKGIFEMEGKFGAMRFYSVRVKL